MTLEKREAIEQQAGIIVQAWQDGDIDPAESAANFKAVYNRYFDSTIIPEKWKESKYVYNSVYAICRVDMGMYRYEKEIKFVPENNMETELEDTARELAKVKAENEKLVSRVMRYERKGTSVTKIPDATIGDDVILSRLRDRSDRETNKFIAGLITWYETHGTWSSNQRWFAKKNVGIL
jgi:hypothetical protein